MYLESQHPRGHGGKWSGSSGGAKLGFWSRRREARAELVRKAQQDKPPRKDDGYAARHWPCVKHCDQGLCKPGCPHDDDSGM